MSPAAKLFAACVALFYAAPAFAASDLVGAWFGRGQRDDKNAMYIDRMLADGRWRGEYRTCVKGKALDQVQDGHWSFQGDILSLRVDTVNGVLWPHTDGYKMLAHSDKAQKYISLGWNFPFTPQRVADDFQMPSCDLVS